MLTEKRFFFVAAIICLVLFIFSLFIYHENFDPTCAPEKPWWEKEPPKQVVSLITGVKVPVIAKEKDKGITSATQSFQIPFIKSGQTETSGCLSYTSENGTFKTEMCDKDKTPQQWVIKPVKDEDSLREILRPVYKSNPYSNIKNFNIDSSPIKLPAGVEYGFFLVVSSANPAIVLASNGGNITVKTLGLHTSEFWDITKEVPHVEIPIYDTNDYALLSTSFVNSNVSGGMQRGQLMHLNSNPGAAYQTPGISAVQSSQSSQSSQKRGGINFNINLGGSSLASLLGGVPSPTGGVGSTETSASASTSEAQAEGFNPNCPSCASPLLDYIPGRDIPCLGCNPPSIIE
jgi:hypothetical protein